MAGYCLLCQYLPIPEPSALWQQYSPCNTLLMEWEEDTVNVVCICRDSNVITQNEHVLTNTDSFVFLAGAANVGKVNVVGFFSTKKEMEVFIWCTLDWAPMHSFAPRYFSYHHNNLTSPCDWSTVHIISSLIGGSLTRQLFLLIVFNFTIFHFHWVS